MHQARVRALPLADHPRSYPAHHPTVPVDDTDTWLLAAAARELEAHLLFERTRQVADVRALLAELYAGDSVAVEDAMLDAQAEDVARLERADRFLQELAAHLQPEAELLEQAAGADDHTLQVWEEAAANLAEEFPPPLASLRSQIEETRRGELRSHAQLVRAETQLAGLCGASAWLGGCGTAATSPCWPASCRTAAGAASRPNAGWLYWRPSWR
jgi:hypothetical protein